MFYLFRVGLVGPPMSRRHFECLPSSSSSSSSMSIGPQKVFRNHTSFWPAQLNWLEEDINRQQQHPNLDRLFLLPQIRNFLFPQSAAVDLFPFLFCKTWMSFPQFIFLGASKHRWFPLILLWALLLQSAAEASQSRSKRQYGYDDGYYSNYYGWQAGRIIGWLIGFFVLLLFICVPCVCCAGIWFLGWFGLRQTMANRRSRRAEEGRVIAARDQREIHARRYIDAPSPVATEQRYVYATDRYYERRPRSPPTTEPGPVPGPYASNGVTRETRRL